MLSHSVTSMVNMPAHQPVTSKKYAGNSMPMMKAHQGSKVPVRSQMSLKASNIDSK